MEGGGDGGASGNESSLDYSTRDARVHDHGCNGNEMAAGCEYEYERGISLCRGSSRLYMMEFV